MQPRGGKFVMLPGRRASVGHEEKEQDNWVLPFLTRGCFCRGTFRLKARVSILLRSPRCCSTGDRVLGTARSTHSNLPGSIALSCPH